MKPVPGLVVVLDEVETLQRVRSDVLDRIDQFGDVDPQTHYALTVTDTELTAAERHAAGAHSADDIELDVRAPSIVSTLPCSTTSSTASAGRPSARCRNRRSRRSSTATTLS